MKEKIFSLTEKTYVHNKKKIQQRIQNKSRFKVIHKRVRNAESLDKKYELLLTQISE